MKVNVDEILRIKARLKEINSLKLEEIEWVNDKGDPIVVEKSLIAEWKFTGLSNCYFAEDVIQDGGKDFKEQLAEENILP